MKDYAFDFNIVDVVNYLQLNVRKYNSTEMYVDCPFCVVNPQNGHSGKGKMRVYITKNQYHCCRCDSGGGMLELISDLHNISKKQARKSMNQYVGSGDYDKDRTSQIYNNAKLAQSNESKKVSVEVLDKVYREFINMCTLHPQHRENLHKRGLTDKEIKRFGFVSVPTHRNQHQRIISRLLLAGYKLEGVPGFFIDKKGNWNFNAFRFAEGFFIPMKDVNNRVNGMQIRLDNPPSDGGKYIWFSSANKDSGTSSGSPYHLVGKVNETIYITEGGLKANIAHYYSGNTFLAIAGVNQVKELPNLFQEFKKQGVTRIVDCFDMDSEINPHVKKAKNKLARIVLNCGLDYLTLKWDKRFKGIDDYLSSIPKEKWLFYCKEFKPKH